MKGRNICVQQKGLHSSDLPCPALPGCSALHGEGQFIFPLKKRLVKARTATQFSTLHIVNFSEFFFQFSVCFGKYSRTT